ncbi:MAG: SMP-30/gluconolactonase/LRE family protein [Planctomycetes bacterium]|nr:SMP-30/gluconolactonase/LRE family protein [Planctomycetota bacterium]
MLLRSALPAAVALALAALAPRAGAQDAPAPPRLAEFRFQVDGLEEPSAAIAIDAGWWIAQAENRVVRALDADGKWSESWGASFPESVVEPRGLAATEGEAARLFVSDAGAHCIVLADGSRIGRRGAAPGEFNTPRGICIAGAKLYVADSRNDRVQVLDFDGKPLVVIGKRGSANGEFLAPLDVAVDARGNVFVADSDNHRVQKFDASGKHLASFGDFGPYPGQFAYPSSLELLGERLYVVDRENHRVQVFDLDGNWKDEIAVHSLLPREGNGKIHYPDAIALSADGKQMLLCEGFENRVQVFGPEPPPDPTQPPPLPPERNVSAHFGPELGAAGNLIVVLEPGASQLALYRAELPEPIQITTTGIHGTRPGELLRPYDAALDLERKLVHVSDPANARLSTFAIVGDYTGELRFDPYLLAFARSLDFAKLHALGKDFGARWIIEPEALALDATGRLFVCDPRNLEVWIVDAKFALVGKLDQGATPFQSVDGLAVDAQGNVYVADRLAGVVRVFGGDGKERTTLGRHELLAPSGVAVDAQGRVWVSDRRTATLACFTVAGNLEAGGKLDARIGAPGLGVDQYFKPRGLALDGRGELVVLDWGNHRGVIRGVAGERAGEILGWFGSRLFTRELRGGNR